MHGSDIKYVHGLTDEYREPAAHLYDAAFGAKFSAAVPSRESRIELLAKSFRLEFAFGAIAADRLIGLAGYKSLKGSFTGGMDYKTLISHLGVIRGNWAAIVFSLYERKPSPGELLMDGIAVDERMRGKGVGTRLLDNLADFVAAEQYQTIRLDVIDTNPGAQRLYERNGFVVTRTERFEYLRWFLGFGASSTMARTIAETAAPNVVTDHAAPGVILENRT